MSKNKLTKKILSYMAAVSAVFIPALHAEAAVGVLPDKDIVGVHAATGAANGGSVNIANRNIDTLSPRTDAALSIMILPIGIILQKTGVPTLLLSLWSMMQRVRLLVIPSTGLMAI